ncbi:hypothetical protein EIN_064990 [Entamoeba invadens IP1]|uniref:CCR4-not transcription complex n=1 Tax=Entamoeba invadens IP1 TaxID=370355 RepID=A0A0A1TV79_ENTIV|nr:hypothetical protein EIN_064990 [Entamoeba invadens IP1]ELP84254.1 hypothetical protein EIN_064990 [Entamoeba invadens IP1]|eukprot:XP_004183600.1 hypothetical protein EIN_064990 [Entamoeba invadens IP1]
MQACLSEINSVLGSLTKKNVKQAQQELSTLVKQTGVSSQINTIKFLTMDVVQDTSKGYKLQVLKDELTKLSTSNLVLQIRKCLSSLALPIQTIKSLALPPHCEFLFGVNQNNEDLTKEELFVQLSEKPLKIKTNADPNDITTPSLPVFSLFSNTTVSSTLSPVNIPLPPDFIIEMGPSCAGSVETFSTLLDNTFGKKDKVCGKLVFLMMKNIEEQEKETKCLWDDEIVGSVIQSRGEACEDLPSIIDDAKYIFKSIEAISFMVRIYTKIGEFPGQKMFIENWVNGRAQGSIIQMLIQMASSPNAEGQFIMKTMCGLYNVGTQRGVKTLWEQLGFVDRVTEVCESSSSEFEACLYQPDFLLPVLCKMKNSSMRQKSVFVMMKGCTRSTQLVQSLWKNYKIILTQGMRDCYLDNPSCVEDIINLLPPTEAAKELTQIRPVFFSLDVACLLCKRDVLNMDKWAGEQSKIRNLFGKEIINFVKDKYLMNKNVSPYRLDLAITRKLLVFSSNLGLQKEAQEVEQQFLAKSNFKENERNASKRANDMFTYYFDGKITVEDFVIKIIKYKESTDTQENDLMIIIFKTLLEEFRRVNEFSKPETVIRFGKLYGEIIRKKVLRNCALIHLLRTILWTVNEPIESNFFKCGSAALKIFQERLPEWPAYCYLLKNAKNLEIFDKDLYAVIATSAKNKFTLVMKLINKLFVSINFQMWLDPKNISIIKALCHSFEEKSEMSTGDVETVSEETFATIGGSQQVHKKMLIEIALFMTGLMYEERQRQCIKVSLDLIGTTEHLCTFAVESVKIFKRQKEYDQQDCSLFEALGSFLGLLTLGLNKPLRTNRLMLKNMIRDETTADNTDVLITFLIRFLSASAQSEIFNSNNPWMVPFIQLVCAFAIYPEFGSHFEEAKRFLTMLKVSPKEYLEEKGNTPENEKTIRKLARLVKEKSNGDGGILGEYIDAKKLVPLALLNQYLLSERSLCFSGLTQGIDYDIPDVLICNSFLEEHWKLMVDVYLDFSIQDNSKTAVDSLNAIMRTVTQIVQKDFAMETDVVKIAEAAERVFGIMQKLLYYTCRSCIVSILWKYLAFSVKCALKQQEEPTVTLEQVKESLINNLQKCVEHAVQVKLDEMKKMAKRIIEQFVSNISAVRQQNGKGQGQDFVAPGYEYLKEGPPLPVELLIAPGGVTKYQMELYADKVSREVTEHLDVHFAKMLNAPIHLDVVEKYIGLLTEEMTTNSINRIIEECVIVGSKEASVRAMQILGMMFLAHKNDQQMVINHLSDIFKKTCSLFEKEYTSKTFNPEAFKNVIESFLEMSVEKIVDGINTIMSVQHILKAFQRLHPSNFPKFSCQWLELFSHRSLLYDLAKAPQNKTQIAMYFELFNKFLQFLQPFLFVNTTATKQLITAAEVCVLQIRECFSLFLYHFGLLLATNIPYRALSLRLPILSVSANEENVRDYFDTILKMMPKEDGEILKGDDDDESCEVFDRIPALIGVVWMLHCEKTEEIKNVVVNAKTETKISVINALADLLREDQVTNGVVRNTLCEITAIGNEEISQIVLRTLVERSIGEYKQMGAINVLSDMIRRR